METVRRDTLKKTGRDRELPKSPENKLAGKVFCAECGTRMQLKRHYRQRTLFRYECGRRGKKEVHGRNGTRKKLSVEETELAVFDIIHKHMAACIDRV